MSLIKTLRYVFPSLEMVNDLPDGINQVELGKNFTTLTSLSWKTKNLRRVRLCDLEVPGKFSAITLVLYPEFSYDIPIFGTEYLCIGSKKFFGAIDFHPISTSTDYALKHLQDFPDRNVDNSKFYDLSEFFSGKFWLHKSSENFYKEYVDLVGRYMVRYKDCVDSATRPSDSFSSKFSQKRYDSHMAENDPAHGILKAYFSDEFAEHYIKNFLFNLAL